jgi:hypothetical protein
MSISSRQEASPPGHYQSSPYFVANPLLWEDQPSPSSVQHEATSAATKLGGCSTNRGQQVQQDKYKTTAFSAEDSVSHTMACDAFQPQLHGLRPPVPRSPLQRQPALKAKQESCEEALSMIVAPLRLRRADVPGPAPEYRATLITCNNK